MLRANELREKMLKSSARSNIRGASWKIVTDRYRKSWDAVWSAAKKRQTDQNFPKRNPPKKKLLSESLNISVPFTSKNNLQIASSEIDVGQFFPSRFDPGQHTIPFVKHREFPQGAEIVRVSIVRTSVHTHAKWWIIFTITVPDNIAQYNFPSTRKSCGIDPGRTTALTVSEPGSSAKPWVEFKSQPHAQHLKKLAKLQRHLDRQIRANNPHCFNEKGEWKGNARITSISKAMRQTYADIADLMRYCKDWRADQYNKFVTTLFKNFDEVYLGNWTDGSPDTTRKSKAKRKKAFEESGEPRAHGQAARQTTQNRTDRDNALGIFRERLKEVANRTNNKKVFLVNEAGIKSTQTCSACGAITGPRNTSVRDWTCTVCEVTHHRDANSGVNHLQSDPNYVTLVAGK
jgi:transposase